MQMSSFCRSYLTPETPRKMKIAIKKIIACAAAILACAVAFSAVNPEAKLHKFSTTIEKERPQLDAETKSLIAAYRKSPTEAKCRKS